MAGLPSTSSGQTPGSGSRSRLALPPPKGQKPTRSDNTNYNPAHWSEYFQSRVILEVPARLADWTPCWEKKNKFCVYSNRDLPFPENRWAKNAHCSEESDSRWACKDALMVFLHGAGFSALTWGTTVKELCMLTEIDMIALDLLGHGDTDVAVTDFSNERMVMEIRDVLEHLNVIRRPLILVGHSWGGSIAINASNSNSAGTFFFEVLGLIVIDVVEGTALNALNGMRTVLANRPSQFRSMPAAIEWCVRSGHIQNLDSARVSMPGQLKSRDTLKCGTQYVELSSDRGSSSDDTIKLASGSNGRSATGASVPPFADSIPEEMEETEEKDGACATETQQNSSSTEASTSCSCRGSSAPQEMKQEKGGFIWRIDLTTTEEYWRSWFQGISRGFLDSPAVAKLLILGGTDRLDTDLTLAQMMGKFQLEVIQNVGHTVHEDSPDAVADLIFRLLIRYKWVSVSKKDDNKSYPAPHFKR